MDVILGIDIGGSTTKIVGLRTDGSVISMLRVRAEDQVTSLYGALGNYLTSNRLSLRDVRRVVLTGVGASYVDGDIYGVRTVKVEEFPSVGVGRSGAEPEGAGGRGEHGHRHLAALGGKAARSATSSAAASAAALWAGSATSWWEWSASARSKSWRRAAIWTM